MGILRWHLFCYFDSSKLPPTKIAHGFGVRFLLYLYVKNMLLWVTTPLCCAAHVTGHKFSLLLKKDLYQYYSQSFALIDRILLIFDIFSRFLHVWVHFV